MAVARFEEADGAIVARLLESRHSKDLSRHNRATRHPYRATSNGDRTRANHWLTCS